MSATNAPIEQRNVVRIIIRDVCRGALQDTKPFGLLLNLHGIKKVCGDCRRRECFDSSEPTNGQCKSIPRRGCNDHNVFRKLQPIGTNNDAIFG